MGKQPKSSGKKKSNRFQKIYREFTRVKFNKYKLQFPRLRESDIVTKILRQWEALDEEGKENLEKQFIERSGAGFLEEDSSSSKRRRQLEKAAAEQKARKQAEEQEGDGKGKKKKKKISPKVRVFEEKSVPKKDDSDFKRSEGKKSGKKSTPDKDKSSESDKFLGKTKTISKNIAKKVDQPSKKQEYFNFYKYYFERLGAEHPRWSKNQITTIIKLLWRKRNKKTRRIGSRGGKGLTGRQLYRRSKETEGFNKEQIKFMWKTLPHESKIYWLIKAQGKPQRNSNLAKKIMNKGASVNQSQIEESKASISHNWINNPMM